MGTAAMTNAVLTPEMRLGHMEYAKAHGVPGLKDRWGSGRISIVGYGSSLQHTWKDIQYPIMATSGAMEFLKERGLRVDYYAALDPRAHKTLWLRRPDPRTVYLMASVVCPFSWAMLQGCPTYQWHALGVEGTKEWCLANDPETCRLRTGSEIGLGAIRLAWWMGYREFDLYGMDHIEGYAGECPNPSQSLIEYMGYRTTPQLLYGALQMHKALKRCTHRVHGESLLNVIPDEPAPVTLVREGRMSVQFVETLAQGGFDSEAFLAECRRAAHKLDTIEPIIVTPPGGPSESVL